MHEGAPRPQAFEGLEKKLQGIASDMPSVFAKQEEQEKGLNERLLALECIVDEEISKKRARHATPQLFTDEDFGPNSGLFNVFSLMHVGDPNYEDVRRFARMNEQGLLRAIDRMNVGLDEIERWADTLEWPAPWRRYTNWGYASTSIRRFVDNVRHMLV